MILIMICAYVLVLLMYSMYMNSCLFITSLDVKNELYFSSLNQANLKIRGVQSIDEYINKYTSSFCEFTTYEKESIKFCVNTIKQKWANVPNDIQFIKSTWDGDMYFPHTIQNVIVLTQSCFRSSLMYIIAHEIFHIFQRRNKHEVFGLYKSMGYTPVTTITFENMYFTPLQNPDTVEFPNFENADGDVFLKTITDDTKNISQAVGTKINVKHGTCVRNEYATYDHINEITADMFAEFITSHRFSDKQFMKFILGS